MNDRQKITRLVIDDELLHPVTVGRISEVVADWNDEQQAAFFNALGKYDWWDMQMANVVEHLDDDGRRFLELCGEYAFVEDSA